MLLSTTRKARSESAKQKEVHKYARQKTKRDNLRCSIIQGLFMSNGLKIILCLIALNVRFASAALERSSSADVEIWPEEQRSTEK